MRGTSETLENLDEVVHPKKESVEEVTEELEASPNPSVK